jgi:hypothetical protein
MLELSKLLRYVFHYEYIAKKYGLFAKLIFTNTDFLCHKIATDDIYADMRNDNYLFDFSDYPASHPNYSMTDCKALGKFKVETHGVAPLEFAGLRSKCSLKLEIFGEQEY